MGQTLTIRVEKVAMNDVVVLRLVIPLPGQGVTPTESLLIGVTRGMLFKVPIPWRSATPLQSDPPELPSRIVTQLG